MNFGKTNILSGYGLECLYSSVLSEFAKSRLISNEEFEIKTYLANVIYLCILSDTDRKKIHNYVSSLIESYYLDDFSEEEINVFDRRMNLYMDIAKGMPVRSECTLCDASVLGSDIILRMLIALTDLMSNPATREDYGNAPVALHGIFESMELYEITVKNVYPIVMDYCSQIPNAIKKL